MGYAAYEHMGKSVKHPGSYQPDYTYIQCIMPFPASCSAVRSLLHFTDGDYDVEWWGVHKRQNNPQKPLAKHLPDMPLHDALLAHAPPPKNCMQLVLQLRIGQPVKVAFIVLFSSSTAASSKRRVSSCRAHVQQSQVACVLLKLVK